MNELIMISQRFRESKVLHCKWGTLDWVIITLIVVKVIDTFQVNTYEVLLKLESQLLCKVRLTWRHRPMLSNHIKIIVLIFSIPFTLVLIIYWHINSLRVGLFTLGTQILINTYIAKIIVEFTIRDTNII